jgi:hypothetical protein
MRALLVIIFLVILAAFIGPLNLIWGLLALGLSYQLIKYCWPLFLVVLLLALGYL